MQRPPVANVILFEQPSNLAALSVRLAFLQEACLGGAGKRLSIGADRLAVARVRLAFLQEARLGGTNQRLAVFPDRFAVTRVVRASGPDGEKRKNDSKNKAFHGQPRLVSRGIVASGNYGGGRDTIMSPPIIPDTLRSFGVFLGKSGPVGLMADQETLLEIESCPEITPNIRAPHRRHAEPLDGPAKFATAARRPGSPHELKPFHLASWHPACSIDVLSSRRCKVFALKSASNKLFIRNQTSWTHRSGNATLRRIRRRCPIMSMETDASYNNLPLSAVQVYLSNGNKQHES
jgi:hypothetical protein